MAKITLTVGAITVERTFPADARAGAALNAFYTNQALGPADATNRQKLEAILLWFVHFVQEKAILGHVEGGRAAAAAEAKTLYQVVDDPPVVAP